MQSLNNRAMTEVEHYLDANHVQYLSESDIFKFDVLQWWKQNQYLYPLSLETVKQMLCVPASSVKSE